MRRSIILVGIFFQIWLFLYFQKCLFSGKKDLESMVKFIETGEQEEVEEEDDYDEDYDDDDFGDEEDEDEDEEDETAEEEEERWKKEMEGKSSDARDEL